MSLHVIRRNFHRAGKPLQAADAFLVSVPKSGRTWLRFLLRHYLCELAGVPFAIDPAPEEPRTIPRLVCSHDLWEHLTTPRRKHRLLGRYLIPRRARREKKIVLAVRDLRDVMVSLHLQLTRRGFRSGASYTGELSEMIRDGRFGAMRTAEIINAWLDEWRDTGRLHVWSYEECRKDPMSSMRDVLAFLGLPDVEEDLLERAIEFSSFDSMKSMEESNAFDRKLLRPGDPSDPESFKVRRGKIGGYEDYMTPSDALLVELASSRIRL